jgi:hypothetical protein
VELSVNTQPIRNKRLSWDLNFNITYNKNTITKLNLAAPVTMGSQRVSQQYVEGFPAFAIFAYEFAGLDQMGDPQIRLADGTVTKTPNVSKVNDVRFMGTYQPVWSGGMANVFNYKSFSLSANAIFNLGHVMRNDVNTFYSGRVTHNNVEIGSTGSGFKGGNLHADFASRWKKPGDELFTSIPAYVSANALSEARRDYFYYTRADINVVNASYIKLRDITLAYALPALLVKKLQADGVTLRVQFSNLMLWKANKNDIDPEFINAINGNRSLLANQGTLSFGLNVKF